MMVRITATMTVKLTTPRSLNEVDTVLLSAGLTAAQIVAIRTEGFERLNDFLTISNKEITDMASRLTSLPVVRGGTRIGVIHIKKLQAIAYWVRDCHNRNQIPDAGAFDAATLLCCQHESAIRKQKRDDPTDADVKSPGKFKANEWVDWEMKLNNYLATLNGSSGIPLNYVICNENDPDRNPNALVWQAPLTGTVFNTDAETIFRIIIQLVVGTDAHEWVKGNEHHKDGCMTIMDLCSHYDGPDMACKCVTKACKSLATLAQ